MLDLSLGQVFFTLTAAMYLIGRKDLPRAAKLVGGYMGRGVGTVIRMKTDFWDSTRDHNLVKLHQEFQQGIKELNSIRAELTEASALRRPHQPHVVSSPPEPVNESETAKLRRLMQAEAVMSMDETLRYESRTEKETGMVDIVHDCLVQHTILKDDQK